MNSSRYGRVALAVLLLSTAIITRAQSGAGLDTSFGSGGQAVTDFFRAADEVRGLAIAADGSLVAAGLAFNPGHGFDFGIARYSAEGTLVPPVAAIDFHPGQALNDEAVAVATLPDGRIIAAGHTASDAAGNDDFAVVRLLPTLAPDPTFGVDGRTTTDFFGKFDLATGMAVQPDGRIVVIGMVTDAAAHQYFGLVRYNIDGALDKSFGTGGRVVTDLAHGSQIPFAVALQLDGKLIVVGVTFNIDANELTMVRYLANGSLDPDFGTGGKVFLNNYTANPHSVTLQSDGRIVVAGIVLTGGQGADFALWRFEANGTLDTTFGTGGRVFTDFGAWDNAGAVAVGPDGKIVAAGYTQLYGKFVSSNFAVARYAANGSLDRTFGANGIAVTDFFGDGDLGEAMVIQPGRGVVVGGLVGNPRNGTTDFGLARFNLQAVTRPAVADAYVRGGGFASINYGGVPHLLAKLGVTDDNSRVSYLKFDLSGITNVARATLRFYGRLSNTANSSVQTTVHGVSNTSWNERTVTWNTKPAVGAALGSVTIRGIAPQWYDVDITAYVQAQQRAGRTTIAIALQTATHTSAYVEVASREAGARGPMLIITPGVRATTQ